MDYKIELKPRDFSDSQDKKPRTDAPYTSSGCLYDLLAVAAGATEYNDLDRFGVTDPAIDYVLKNYDYEKAYIEALNGAGDSNDYAEACRLFGEDAQDGGELWAAFQAQALKLGAFHALKNADRFPDDLEAWTDKVKEDAREYWQDPAGVPQDLLTSCMEAADEAENDMLKEYLHGDYNSRNWAGVYKEAQRALFRDRDLTLYQSDKDRTKNILRVDIDELEGRQIVADFEGVELSAARIGTERVKKAVALTILYAAKLNYNKEKEARARRSAEYKDREDRRRAEQEAAEATRRAGLLAMTKAA